MNPLIELDQLTLDAADKSQLIAWVQALVIQATETTAQLQANAAEIKRKDFKIEALTFELSRLRRIQFGVKNETLSPLQRDIFAETLATDIAAIGVELEQLTAVELCATVAKPKRPRADRQPLPDHLPRIEHRHEPESCQCGQCGNDLVKIGDDCMDAGGRATQEQLPETSPNNWMWNRPSSLSIATSVRNTPAAYVKPLPLPRFHRPLSTAAWPLWAC
jgi:transposase